MSKSGRAGPEATVYVEGSSRNSVVAIENGYRQSDLGAACSNHEKRRILIRIETYNQVA